MLFNVREGPEYLFRDKSISQTIELSYDASEDASVLLVCNLLA